MEKLYFKGIIIIDDPLQEGEKPSKEKISKYFRAVKKRINKNTPIIIIKSKLNCNYRNTI